MDQSCKVVGSDSFSEQFEGCLNGGLTAGAMTNDEKRPARALDGFRGLHYSTDLATIEGLHRLPIFVKEDCQVI